ncbi:MAG: long-chain acyl-CoA synthetase [Myxococcales bacterium]
MARDTIVDRFFANAARMPSHPALYQKEHGHWHPISWKEYADDVRRFGCALIANGVPHGAAVTVLANNRPEWLIADVGAMAVGCVPAGIYQTCTPEQVAYIVEHAEAPVCVVENRVQWEKVHSRLDSLPQLRKVVLLDEGDEVDHPKAVSWEAFLAEGAGAEEDHAVRMSAIREAELATLIYTSGTTGPPKGAMLSHKNLAWTARSAIDMMTRGGEAVSPDDCSLSYLPLSHIAEQMFSIHLPITGGYPIWFAEGLDKLKDNLPEARPTIFLAVPRVWEKFAAALQGKLALATGFKAKLVDFARSTARQVGELRKRGEEPTGLLALRYAVADRLVLSKVKAAIGLDRGRLLVTGAAPISRDVLDFFLSLDLLIYEVYGQSEGSGPTSFNQPGAVKFGTVGQALPGVDVLIAPDGEILVRGDNVFMGYFKAPEATAEALSDGWLHSGDVGELTETGHLRITDRKKDLIITAGGKNVAPQNIEARLKDLDLVSQAVVIGDSRPYLVALLTLDPEAAAVFASANGLPSDLAALAAHPKVRAHLERGIERVNEGLARYETVKRFEILSSDFSVDGGELTPTLKVKRKVVNEKHGDAIARLYA